MNMFGGKWFSFQVSETHKCFMDGHTVSEDSLYLTEGLPSRWHTKDKLEDALFVYLPMRQH